MQATVLGKPAFAHIRVDLDPGESLIAESSAMSSMSADLDMSAQLNGGVISGIGKSLLGGESLFVNHFTNNARETRHLYLTQPTPGDIREVELKGNSLCLQPGAYICSTPGVSLGVQWAGFGSWIAREGLFKLLVSGTGKVWYGAYGGLIEKEVKGEYIVDTSHLVAYDPGLKLKVQFAGGIFSSFFGGEGLVTRIEGNGKILMQTRSMDGLAGWVNPRL